MRITPNAALPFQLARAYGLAQPNAASRAQAAAATSPLIAAKVARPVDFSATAPQPSLDAIAMYRHPADRNAAATGVEAGRTIDLSA